MRKSLKIAMFSFIVGLTFTATGFAQVNKTDLAEVRQKAIEYLKLRGQNSEGAFSPKIGIGVTALAATALMENGVLLFSPLLLD